MPFFLRTHPIGHFLLFFSPANLFPTSGAAASHALALGMGSPPLQELAPFADSVYSDPDAGVGAGGGMDGGGGFGGVGGAGGGIFGGDGAEPPP